MTEWFDEIATLIFLTLAVLERYFLSHAVSPSGIKAYLKTQKQDKTCSLPKNIKLKGHNVFCPFFNSWSHILDS